MPLSMSRPSIQLTQPLLGRRRHARLRVGLKARLITLDGLVHAVLADVARLGARVCAPDCELRPGREAVLVWDQYEAFGEVVWNDGQFVGLHFDQPLGAPVLLATRALEDARVMPIERQLVREAAQAFVDPRRKH